MKMTVKVFPFTSFLSFIQLHYELLWNLNIDSESSIKDATSSVLNNLIHTLTFSTRMLDFECEVFEISVDRLNFDSVSMSKMT